MKKVYKIIGFAAIAVLTAGISGYYAFAIGSTEPASVILSDAGASHISQTQATSSISILPDNSSSTPVQAIASTTPAKRIVVDLKEQRLTYYDGDVEQGSFLISSGVRGKETPTGTFYVLKKIPVKLYKGPGYYLPNTKWNLNFLPGYYIHGAYWHNNFGHPMSHGCINVSYKNMEGLYNWADVGTQIIIHA